ncbi:hypothetical protein BC828DRAFT_346015, partial [Blastocladiella britannica]
MPLLHIRHFCRHLQRYVAMHGPLAGFDVVETRRYAALSPEMWPGRGVSQAAIIATRDWAVGDELFLCGGHLAAMSSSEETLLAQTGRDFSILFSRRSNEHNLFLGPGRFINHDCRPNLAFVVRGSGEVHFRIIRAVTVGTELVVSYGGDYFSNGNSECMCESCER